MGLLGQKVLKYTAKVSFWIFFVDEEMGQNTKVWTMMMMNLCYQP